MSDQDGPSNLLAQADLAQKQFVSDVLPRLRAQLKAVGLEAQGFGFADGAVEKTFLPSLGASELLHAAFDMDPSSVRSSLPELPVESLLDQASKLIDRVAIDDASRRAMLIDRFNLWLDLEEYNALDRINESEIAQGLYTLPLEDALAAYKSEANTRLWQQEYVDAMSKNRVRQQQLSGWATEVAQRHNPGGGGGTALWGSYSSTLPETAGQGKDSGTYATDGWLGGVISYEITYNQISLQLIERSGEAGSSAARLPHLKNKVDYYTKDVEFRSQRRAVAQLKLHRKMAEASREDGVLNYTPRIEAGVKRILADLKAAYERLSAAKRG